MVKEKLKPKGLAEFLEEDSSLKEKITYDQYIQNGAVPENSDDELEKVYQVYCKILKERNSESLN